MCGRYNILSNAQAWLKAWGLPCNDLPVERWSARDRPRILQREHARIEVQRGAGGSGTRTGDAAVAVLPFLVRALGALTRFL